jgi:hypothetical protein
MLVIGRARSAAMTGTGVSAGMQQRAGLAILEAGLVVGVLYYIGHRDWVFMGSIAAAIAVAALAPPRFSALVTGLCLLALAALFYVLYHWSRIPTVLGVAGVIAVVWGAVRLRK